MEHIHTYDETEISFHNVDVHASKVRTSNMTSVSTLIDFFNKPIAEDKYRELFLVRAFLVWMNNIRTQETEELSGEIKDLLKEHKATALTTFCKSANIQAETIFSVGKDLKYVPGHTESDKDSIVKTSWVAFKSYGRWHLVDPQRVLGAVSGYQRGNEILLEDQGKKIFEAQNESKGTEITYVNDFWFCLHPSIFIYMCLPDDPEWQLLPIEQRKNMYDFLCLPYLRPSFFKAKLQLLSEQTCVLHTKNGRSIVAFGADKYEARYISMQYQLSLRSDTRNLKGIDSIDYPLLVRYAPGIGTFSFNIRLPVSGEYIFKPYVSAPGTDGFYCCSEFKIICTQSDPNCKKLPMDAGRVGYGFGYSAVDFGLKNPSSAQPNIIMKNPQKEDSAVMKEITFQIEDDRIADVEFSSDIIGEVYKDNVFTETHVDEVSGRLYVKAGMKNTETHADEVSGRLYKAGMKKDGEFALSIMAREKNSNQRKRIVNYLVTTQSYEEDDDFQRLSKKRKKELTLQVKIQELNDKKAALIERMKAMQTETADLQKIYEKNKNNKRVQTEDILVSKQHSTETRTTQTTDNISINETGIQTESIIIAMFADKRTQTEKLEADTGPRVTRNNKRTQTEKIEADIGPRVTRNNKRTQTEKIEADTGPRAPKNEQHFHFDAIERDGKIFIVVSNSDGKQIQCIDTGKQTASPKSKICTVS